MKLGTVTTRVRRAFLAAGPGAILTTRQITEYSHPRRARPFRSWLVTRAAERVAERVGRRERGAGGGSGRGQTLWRAKPGIEDIARRR
jgi:hypothetical protein